MAPKGAEPPDIIYEWPKGSAAPDLEWLFNLSPHTHQYSFYHNKFCR